MKALIRMIWRLLSQGSLLLNQSLIIVYESIGRLKFIFHSKVNVQAMKFTCLPLEVTSEYDFFAKHLESLDYNKHFLRRRIFSKWSGSRDICKIKVLCSLFSPSGKISNLKIELLNNFAENTTFLSGVKVRTSLQNRSFMKGRNVS